MIKFFRLLRQRLLSEGKTGKYFKYAIGEIILVVIGILIALQINNWNENRKDRIVEQILYKSLISSLESDLKDVNDKILIVDKALNAQNIFITISFEKIKERYDINQIVDLLYAVSESSRSFFPNYGLYNKITNNNNIDLIQSNELQIKIIELYEQYYKRYNDLDLNIEQQSLFSLNTNFFSKIQNYATDYGRYKITFEILGKHYDQLNEECRKINILTILTHESMIRCKNEIESLLSELRKTSNQ
ncbi:DUF6090 family protein [Winogradskyella aquimaris]|uniref:DUF6090 family protein n=1 Tax=Winogradskyella aquimaris TaxID=864074 RepID=A0ABU5ENB3_9FLAO|nr:DUF6090 family protein [Winogradskyella aquimaris]MDY2587949.1 DUF6090 family protein [Winogradskyella aquimaris]